MSDIGKTMFDAAFLVFAGVTMLGALGVVCFRNLLHAAVSLFFCLAGVAALYIFIGADFLGVTQLLVYAGGILVLIIFGVFMTAKIYGANMEVTKPSVSVIGGLIVAAGLFGVILSIVGKTEWTTKTPTYAPTTAKLGELFLTKYVLPFEVISILLLFAMIGAVTVAAKELKGR